MMIQARDFVWSQPSSGTAPQVIGVIGVPMVVDESRGDLLHLP